MITKVLLFNTEHEAAKALKSLENSGTSARSLSVLVSNVEHSRLLNAETAIHIDLLSEIASANRRDERELDRLDGASNADAGYEEDDGDGDILNREGFASGFSIGGTPAGLFVPFYAQQPTTQVPSIGILGAGLGFEQHEQGVPSLQAYGLSEENAHHCLEALRAGQCIVCIRETDESFNKIPLTDLGAAKVLENSM